MDTRLRFVRHNFFFCYNFARVELVRSPLIKVTNNFCQGGHVHVYLLINQGGKNQLNLNELILDIHSTSSGHLR